MYLGSGTHCNLLITFGKEVNEWCDGNTYESAIITLKWSHIVLVQTGSDIAKVGKGGHLPPHHKVVVLYKLASN